ncbi:MAG TPA: STAS domain-containing protein [Vicinamibacteria bacterium]|nr:STAS domain-containing protein [Vicinamibacteria bacterium]
MFQYSLEQSGEVGIVRVKEAKLTYPVLSPFFDAVRRIVEGGARKLVIDLGAVAYMDSVAIGCLIDIHRLLEHRQGAVKFSGLQPRLETMLFMTGVQRRCRFTVMRRRRWRRSAASGSRATMS